MSAIQFDHLKAPAELPAEMVTFERCETKLTKIPRCGYPRACTELRIEEDAASAGLHYACNRSRDAPVSFNRQITNMTA
jgi:hypothetical protein